MSATTALYGHLRTRLLDFVPTEGNALRASVGTRLYTLQAPDNAGLPHGVLRIQSRTTGTVDDGRLGERGEIELQWFARPRSALTAVERFADVCEAALLHYHTDTVGVLTIRRLIARDTLPPNTEPADRELVQLRLVWSYTWWPTYRTT